MSRGIGKQQRVFTRLVGVLIGWIYANGYEATFGEAWRTPEQAALNAKKGSGIVNSLHTRRLAVDLLLFKDGVYLTKTEDYEPVGKAWEDLGGSWGGRFTKPDGDHFSLSNDGGKTR